MFLIQHICCPRVVKLAVRQPFDRSTGTRKYRRKTWIRRAPLPLLLLHPLLSLRTIGTYIILLSSLLSFEISLEFDGGIEDTFEIFRVDCVRLRVVMVT